MLTVQKQVHMVHTCLNGHLQEGLETLLREVFGAETYHKSFVPELDRDAALMLVGDMCIEPLSKRFTGKPVGSAEWIKTNGQRFHSIAFKIEDVKKADAHMRQHGLRCIYADEIYRDTFFLSHEDDTHNAVIEYCRVEMPNDPRIKPEWSADKWRDEHPLAIEKLSSVSVLVHDYEGAKKLYRDKLEFKLLGERKVSAEGVQAATLWCGDTIFEVYHPVEKDTPAHRFLRNRGQGWYSVNWKVKSAARAAEYLKSHGLRTEGDPKRRFTIDSRDTFNAVYGFTEEEIPGDPRVTPLS